MTSNPDLGTGSSCLTSEEIRAVAEGRHLLQEDQQSTTGGSRLTDEEIAGVAGVPVAEYRRRHRRVAVPRAPQLFGRVVAGFVVPGFASLGIPTVTGPALGILTALGIANRFGLRPEPILVDFGPPPSKFQPRVRCVPRPASWARTPESRRNGRAKSTRRTSQRRATSHGCVGAPASGSGSGNSGSGGTSTTRSADGGDDGGDGGDGDGPGQIASLGMVPWPFAPASSGEIGRAHV
jgi:hypothetical protein